MRIYDTRLGRFLSVDPLTKEYPELTPYQFASNRPIDGIDRDGLEWSPAEVVSSYAGYNLTGGNQTQQAQTFNRHLKEALKNPKTYEQAWLIVAQTVVWSMAGIMTEGVGAGAFARAATKGSKFSPEIPYAVPEVPVTPEPKFKYLKNIEFKIKEL